MSLNKKIYWLASYPKSGNTWFRIFLANYLNNDNNPISINKISTGSIASSRTLFDNISALTATDLTADEIDLLRPDIYRELVQDLKDNSYNKVHDAYILNTENKPLFPTDISAGVIYFVRNPLDVVVSYANHNSVSIDKAITMMNNDKHKLSKSNKKLSTQIRQKLLTWSAHVLSWTEQNQIPVLIVRYEDMLTDTFNTFKKAIEFLNLAIDVDKIETSIELSSFKNLKKQEENFGFKEKPIKTESFFKSGKSGTWENVLTKEQVKIITDNNKDIMIKFGYL